MALKLLQGLGLELELMVVDQDTLDVRPLAERALFVASGNESGDHDNGRIGWSNELVAHVLELKMNAPEPDLSGVAAAFQENVRAVEALLEPAGARLMPGGMHPWMDPRCETVLWPHAYSEVYRTYDRLFDCRRHGWANLQSVHLNLAFGDDQEFGRLHAAVRLVLPLIPALAASSPVMEGRLTGLCDTRLEVYRTNATRVPLMTGAIVPEPVFDAAAYRAAILEPLQRAVAEIEPTGILEGEWLNARGAIARFDRDAIEIRLIDAQECPAADVAVAWAVTCVVGELCQERWCSGAAQRAFATAPLAALFEAAVRLGPAAPVADPSYARALGWTRAGAPTLGELWRELVARAVVPHPRTTQALLAPLEHVLGRGTLSERLQRALGPAPAGDVDRSRLARVYRELCECLRAGRLFGER